MLSAALCAQPPTGLREFTLRDLVRAADGRLAVHAKNLKTGRTVSHDAERAFPLGMARGLPLAGALLARLREQRRTPAFSVPYSRTDYRGPGQLGRRHDADWSVLQLLRALLRHDDPSALDLLWQLLPEGGVAAWLKARGIPGFGPLTSIAEDDRELLGAFEPRFLRASPEARALWLRDQDASGVVPGIFPRDPRSLPDGPARLRAARAKRSRGPWNTATPRALASLMESLYQRQAGHPEDCRMIWDLLRSAPRLRCADSLPLAWMAGGKDASGEGYALSVCVVETSTGPLVMAVHARGYSWPAMIDGFLRGISRAVVKALAPGARVPDPSLLSHPRGLIQCVLLEREQALAVQLEEHDLHDRGVARRTAVQTEVFTRDQRPALVVLAGGEHERVLSVRWLRPDGGWFTQRVAIPAGTLRSQLLVLPDSPDVTAAGVDAGRAEGSRSPAPGTWRVRAALDAQMILDAAFSILPRRSRQER